MNIIVDNIVGSKARFTLYDNGKVIIKTDAFIGEKGVTELKKEGDGKTPLGTFKLGIFFGTHDVDKDNYVKIDDRLYWISDVKSKYYNRLVNIDDVVADWSSSEHLIEYDVQYEYAIEIKINPFNIPSRGSAIFLHCSFNRPTLGCIAVDRSVMERLFGLLDFNEDMEIKIG